MIYTTCTLAEGNVKAMSDIWKYNYVSDEWTYLTGSIDDVYYVGVTV